jgi:plasmid maintenance system killer protein
MGSSILLLERKPCGLYCNTHSSLFMSLSYRLCFRWTNEGPTDVEIVDYH